MERKIAIILVLAVVFGCALIVVTGILLFPILFSMSLYNPAPPSEHCTFPAGISCLDANISADGEVSLTIVDLTFKRMTVCDIRCGETEASISTPLRSECKNIATLGHGQEHTITVSDGYPDGTGPCAPGGYDEAGKQFSGFVALFYYLEGDPEENYIRAATGNVRTTIKP